MMKILFAALIAATPALQIKEQSAGLAAKAKVTSAIAIAAAQAKLPKAKIVSAEIEEEKGALIYSFDMKTPGASGIDEVAVDAMTGKVLSVEHESPADEAKEAAQDAK